MNIEKFASIADSLRQYRRAELRDFATEIGGNPIDALYVDPLAGDAVLNTVLSPNTTFLLGRKGTGKSTVFAKAQAVIRTGKDLISVYVDVKSLDELLLSGSPAVVDPGIDIDPTICRAHLLRKHFLGAIISQLITELTSACDNMSIWDRWTGRKRGYEELKNELGKIAESVQTSTLTPEELPVLQRIVSKSRTRHEGQHGSTATAASKTGATTDVSVVNVKVGAEASSAITAEDFAKSLDDKELYTEYSNVVLRSFPFAGLMQQITDLLNEAGLTRVVVFFDDFSEIDWISQRLFVDVILAPLNNASNEKVKLKVAGYPGRVYYGRIDPGKVDTVHLDFSELYKAQEIQTSEATAVDYTQRLLARRFDSFGVSVSDYLETSFAPSDFYHLVFQATSNVPRLVGYILHFCYLDRIAKGLPLNAASIRLAAEKYYSTVVRHYFDLAGRFALEPFARKLDRHNQQNLLNALVGEAINVRKGIRGKKLGGTYFDSIPNPPVSHFAISPKLETVMASLEFNFLVSKYTEARDKNGKDVLIYALFYGLCEAERIPWGYPKGREYRSYLVQRCFDYNNVVRQFLSKTQTIRCRECGACHPIDKQEHFEFFKWKCNECNIGTCEIVQLGDDFRSEVQALDQAVMLEEVEIGIIKILKDEKRAMRAGEIGALLDETYQLVGKRTAKLKEQGLVEKSVIDGANKSTITSKAISIYFEDNSSLSEPVPDSEGLAEE